MGFSQDIKNEILKNLSTNACCRQAFLSAIIKTSAEYGISNGDLNVSVKTQIQELGELIKDIAENFFDIRANIRVSEELFFNKPRFEVVLTGNKIKQMLIDLDVAYFDENNCFNFYDGLNLANLTEECCIKSFVKGAFIACGSASGVDEIKKKSIDYHLEWVFASKQKSQDFMKLLENINIYARVVKRKKIFVVYLQKFEAISDMLVLFDAQENMLKLNGEYAKRSIMNSVNRQSNCDTANMSKTIDNALIQLKAIELIKQTIGLEKLDDDLADVCMLRMANSEETLQELANLSGMSKSAINYRLGKIMKIAKEIEEEQK